MELIEVGLRLKGTFKRLNDFEVYDGGSESTSAEKPRRSGPTRDARTYNAVEEFEGIVDKVTRGGAFVKFDDGRASGFLPVEEIRVENEDNPSDIPADELLDENQEVTIRSVANCFAGCALVL